LFNQRKNDGPETLEKKTKNQILSKMYFLKEIEKKIQNNLKIREFLHEKISLSECQDIIKEGITYREEFFLSFIKKTIYENKKSPYLELLKLSHIGYEDIKRMVSRTGIEEALKVLKDEGVYITYEEFKKEKEVIRKGKAFTFKKEDFLNPFLDRLGKVYSGFSSGAPTKIDFSIEYLMQRLIHEAVVFDLHKFTEAPLGVWLPTVPAVTALYPMRLQKIGVSPEIWFSQFRSPNEDLFLHKRMFFIMKGHLWRSFVGARWPRAKYVSLRDAYIVTNWAANMIKRYSKCSIQTFVSSAVRICAVAKEKGLNIAGTKFSLAGESLTERKRKEIEEAGCKIIISYYFTEGGIAGCSCDNPENKADEIHFFKDNFAVIQNLREIASEKINLFLFTCFYQGCPIIMLNMENGDYGVIEEKRCGCSLDQYGLFDHIYNIRSYEKINCEGMTFCTSDISNIVEEEFPVQFGGSTIDYQVVEEEDKTGLTRLCIYVSPEIKNIDEEKARQILFDKLSFGGKNSQQIKSWEEAGTVLVKRKYPLETPRGKIFPFYKVAIK